MKIIDIINNTPDTMEVPWGVWTCFGQNTKQIMFAGKQVSLGEDFKSVQEVRAAIEWYANQLGGKVKWSKE